MAVIHLSMVKGKKEGTHRERGTSLWEDLALESGLLRCPSDLGSMPFYFLSGINLSNGMAYDGSANQPYQISERKNENWLRELLQWLSGRLLGKTHTK